MTQARTKRQSRSAPTPADLTADVASLVEHLADTLDATKFSARDLAYLRAPKILHPGGETGQLIANVIPQARLALLHSGEHALATEEEALAYLSSASLCFPLNSDHAVIMFYLADHVMARWYAQPEVWRQIGLETPPQLSAYQQELLRDLCGQIRRAAEKYGAQK